MAQPALRFPIVTAQATWVAAVVFLLMVKAVAAGQLTALVTEVSADGRGLYRDQILATGQSFELGADARVVLAYLDSCILETINGGRFTVGTEKSDLVGGKIRRVRFDCLVGNTLSAGPNAEAGGAYSRSLVGPPPLGSTQPILLVSGAEPD